MDAELRQSHLTPYAGTMRDVEVFSGIQPSGELHLGNYFGAVENWVRIQEKHRCVFAVVDLHAMTVPYEAKNLRANTTAMIVDLLASGVDLEKCTLILQSLVPEHTELAWLFACVTPYSWLAKMTQFKDKSRQIEESGASFSGGLLVYPLLMSADILLYRAAKVPVGEDQDQHLELARDIARTFNARFGETFPEPQPLYTKTPKILSLADPTKKMSKSLGPKHCVGLFEDPASIRKKISSAVTDTGAVTHGGALSPGVEGLLTLLAAAGRADRAADLRAQYAKGERKYAPLKAEVADAIVALVEPKRARRAELLAKGDAAVEEVRDRSADARRLAAKTLADARERMGLSRAHVPAPA
jgi:tryptophanyl-tRNA synthetase